MSLKQNSLSSLDMDNSPTELSNALEVWSNVNFKVIKSVDNLMQILLTILPDRTTSEAQSIPI
jgi:hypothetical protein